jgi:hypothetical protein
MTTGAAAADVGAALAHQDGDAAPAAIGLLTIRPAADPGIESLEQAVPPDRRRTL